MTKFKTEETEHNYINMLFDNVIEVAFFKETNPNLKFECISDKKEARIKGMVIDAKETALKMQLYCRNSIQNIMVAEDMETKVLQMMGLPNNAKNIGVTICKDCLDKAINIIDDYLKIMKDIKEAIE